MMLADRAVISFSNATFRLAIGSAVAKSVRKMSCRGKKVHNCVVLLRFWPTL